MTHLVVAFRNFANEPKSDFLGKKKFARKYISLVISGKITFTKLSTGEK
jgi:hypothetical protein